MTYFIKLYNS